MAVDERRPQQRGGARGPGGPGRPDQRPPGPRRYLGLLAQGWIWLLVGLLVVNWVLTSYVLPQPAPARITVPYSMFKEQVEASNVSQITSRGDVILGTFKQAVTYPPAGQPGSQTATQFTTQVPVFASKGLEALLDQNGVAISAAPLDVGSPAWLSILLSFGPALLIFGLLIWLNTRTQQAQGGVFGIGRSQARRYDAAGGQVRITFADVAGIDEAKADLEEIVDFLKRPEKYQRLGGSIPKGVLLVGQPGTGKTLLARAVAGEAGVPFFSLSGSEFVEMIVGVGAARVRDLFSQAKKEAPAIIFVDELDAIGRRRGGIGFGGANQEQEQTLNQILTEMDGFDGRQAVIVIAATNRPDVLDPALLRPGRFDRRVTVLPPDRVGREAILNVHTRGVPLSRDINLGAIASATPGLVGADLRNLVNEAALTAAHRNRDSVTKADFFEALEKITLGAARKLVMSVDDRKRVAYHEAGHALMGLLLPDVDPVQKVTIVPRGQALGVTYQVPLDDRLSYGESYLRGRIAGALGGRAAESLVFGSVSTGAENDLQQATRIARQMVTRWGMSDKVGLVYVAREDGGFLGGDTMMPDLGHGLSDRLGALVDAETKRIVSECYVITEESLARERPRLEALAEALLERESLDEDEIWRVTGITKPTRGVPAIGQPAPGGTSGGATASASAGDGKDGRLPGSPEAPAGPGAPALTPAVA